MTFLQSEKELCQVRCPLHPLACGRNQENCRPATATDTPPTAPHENNPTSPDTPGPPHPTSSSKTSASRRSKTAAAKPRTPSPDTISAIRTMFITMLISISFPRTAPLRKRRLQRSHRPQSQLHRQQRRQIKRPTHRPPQHIQRQRTHNQHRAEQHNARLRSAATPAR